MNRTTSLSALATLLLAGAASAFAQSATYKIDTAHSGVDFGIKHMAISTVHGHFAIKSGEVVYDPNAPEKAKVDAVIDVTTVDTAQAQRDEHLRGTGFFDTGKFPTAEFKSTSVKKSGDGLDVTGDLTLHGVTKPVVLHMDPPTKEQLGMDGKSLARGFSGTTTINRKDFGLVWAGSLKSGDAVLGDDVKLTLEVEGQKQ